MSSTLFPIDNRALFPTYIAQTHSVILRMLKILDLICAKYEIDYWLDYGTLLGAIRHKGFIPWDVEADVGMLRSDYEIFQGAAVKELPEEIFLQTRDTDPAYLQPSYCIEAKLRDKYSNYVDFSQANPQCKWHNGIQVDIFVYDLDNVLDDCLTNSYERLLSNRRIYFKKEELEYVARQPFEDHEFPVPAGFDAYLKRNYANYWELPPLEKQVAEAVEVFSPCNHSAILHWDGPRFI